MSHCASSLWHVVKQTLSGSYANRNTYKELPGAIIGLGPFMPAWFYMIQGKTRFRHFNMHRVRKVKKKGHHNFHPH
jgi:hypothetical protein